eukprot:543251_1
MASFMENYFNVPPKQSPDPSPEPEPAPNAQKSTKQIKFDRILSSKDKNYAPIKVHMKYSSNTDCIKCACGSSLWTKKRTKPSDLTEHFPSRGHKQYITDKKNRELNRIAKFKKNAAEALNDLKDDVKSILYYPFLFPTFVCVYFIVLHRLPLHLIGPFNALLIFLGVKCSGLSYLWAINDMVAAIYIVRYNEIKYTIQQSNWFGVTEDESQSKVASTGYLSLACKYRDRFAHKNCHHQVKLKALKGQKAVTLANATIEFVNQDLELEDDNFLCITGDNCATNTGHRGGVFKLVQDVFMFILIFGCFAHKLALAISAALLLLPYFVAIEIIVKRIIKWARAGANRSRELVEAAETVEEDARKIGIIHKIRWLGRLNVCNAIYKSKYSVLHVLKNEFEQEQADALWLYPRVTCIYFWLLFCMFLDILVIIGFLQRYFQGNWIYCGKAGKRIIETKEQLDTKLDVEVRGHYTNSFLYDLSIGKFEEYGVDKNSIDAKVMTWLTIRYAEAKPVVKNEIDKQYPPKTLEICDRFAVFSPQNLREIVERKDKNAFGKYGVTEMKELRKILTRPSRVIPEVDLLIQWDEIKMKMRRQLIENPDLTDEEFWSDMMIEYDVKNKDHDYFCVLLIYDASLQISIHSSQNERVFLVMNDIKRFNIR